MEDRGRGGGCSRRVLHLRVLGSLARHRTFEERGWFVPDVYQLLLSEAGVESD